MSRSYVIILSESEDEHDNMPPTIFISDSDDESYHSEPIEEEEHPASEYVPTDVENEEEPSEEDPSEQEVEAESEETVPETPFPSPPTYWTNYTSGPRIIRTARKRVAIPYQQVMPSPESSVPTTDPYIAPYEPIPTAHRRTDARKWSWLPDTLQTWREEEGFPTISEVGESSITGQEYPFTREPPHHTVPLLVARMSSQELRIEHAENSIDAMPGYDSIEYLQDQISTIGHHLEGLRDVTQDTREHAEESVNRNAVMERRVADVERRMAHMERSIEQLSTMAGTMKDYAAFILRGDHIPKKD